MRGGLTAVAILIGLGVILVIGGIVHARYEIRHAPRPQVAEKDIVRLPGDPYGAIPSPDGRWLFVSIGRTPTRGGVAVLKRNAGHIQLARVVPVTPEPAEMALTHDGRLLIAAADTRVVFLDVARATAGAGDPLLGSIDLHGSKVGSFSLNVTPDDKLLFVSEEWAAVIAVIDLDRARKTGYRNDAILGTIPVGVRPFGLAFSPDGKWLYTTSEEAAPEWSWPAECTREGGGNPEIVDPQGAVVVVDVEKARRSPAEAVVARVPAACTPVRAAISAEGDRLFVTARNSNAVVVFDAAKLPSDGSHARIALLPVGQSPTPMAVVDGGTKLLVGNSNRYATPNPPGTLTVLDTAKLQQGAGAVLGIVHTGVFPREMSVSPAGNTVFLTNWGSDFLQVIDLKNLQLIPSH
jgi:DNA-binding beta-propeller fold protein YncE